MNSASAPVRKRIVLLGATGSIGQNTLRVISAHPDKLELVGIAAHSRWSQLATIAREHRVPHVAIFDDSACREARSSGAFPAGTQIEAGMAGLVNLATLPEADIVLVAVVGTTGLRPALAAIEAGKDLALAAKEILVLAGEFVMAAARRSGVRLLPVDSEHDAVSQCIQGHPGKTIHRVVLTASGGAFRDWPLERLAQATPAEALKHPNWSMGPKVTIDSATLANKGLELIEARWLFDLRPDQCDAILHPPSLVHCLVEFTDGALLAHLGPPSMTFPIQHALLQPERPPGPDRGLDLSRAFSLEFKPVDERRYPMLRLAKQAMRGSGAEPAIYNAANEVAVEAFAQRGLPYLAIPQIVEHALNVVPAAPADDLDSILAIDAEARRSAEDAVRRYV